MTSDLESRLRQAVHAEADSVTPADDAATLTAIRTHVRAAHRRRGAVAALGVVALVAGVAVAVPHIGDHQSVGTGNPPADRTTTAATTPPTTALTPTTGPTTSPTTAAGGATTTPTTPPPTTTPPPGNPLGAGYQPLYPFTSPADVQSWQDAFHQGGQQPWHLDAGSTALSFTGFLGFGEIDRVVSTDEGGDDAHIGVGYLDPNGHANTAAVIHLRKFGSGADAPWEVVGTADTDLTLDTPHYGATVTSPVAVGGRITGVDEDLYVRVFQASSAGPIGESCCHPAGGVDTPWQASVSYTGATDPALIVVVSTGGHLQAVERFAVTGVRP